MNYYVLMEFKDKTLHIGEYEISSTKIKWVKFHDSDEVFCDIYFLDNPIKALATIKDEVMQNLPSDYLNITTNKEREEINKSIINIFESQFKIIQEKKGKQSLF